MPQLTYAGGSVEIDDQGYLVNLADWNEDVAQAVATREGMDQLDEAMLEVIRFLRSYYQKFNAFPILNYVCKNIHQPRNCVSDEFINPEKAWKIAGLPKMEGFHFISTDGRHYVMEAPS
ncbi:TusE/DsrC/DsvC family sulfur relay protein [Desulfurivibrio dismutans]|uniref:TusE/DsrC/DsvC family sulfur relay protein n=1 Tax=Desulfurivibrio dismutans TaxID=1398908 RepID=UPI0023DA2976|nr:TusE/DsrC/DsvC family sulfur relay protein [Desulfurivibrio alkaliphilus]MDF1614383.1 TusE/DsrC/DsvC family sulfur relay protein [Desulfurivibrio alkaliphilus]